MASTRDKETETKTPPAVLFVGGWQLGAVVPASLE